MCTQDHLESLDHLERGGQGELKEWRALLVHLGQKDCKVWLSLFFILWSGVTSFFLVQFAGFKGEPGNSGPPGPPGSDGKHVIVLTYSLSL
jgi:hypothetical protein